MGVVVVQELLQSPGLLELFYKDNVGFTGVWLKTPMQWFPIRESEPPKELQDKSKGSQDEWKDIAAPHIFLTFLYCLLFLL